MRLQSSTNLKYVAKRTVWSPNLICPEESLWSIFNRFNYINRLTKNEFKSHLGLDETLPYSINLITGLCSQSNRLTSRNGGRTFYKFVKDELSLTNFSSATLYDTKNLLLTPNTNYLRFCPLCIKESFHSVLFQYPHVNTCPIHEVEIKNRCPGCGYPIDVKFNKTPLALSYSCAKCKELLADKNSMLYPQKTLLSSLNSLAKMWKMRKSIEYIDTTPVAFMVHQSQLKSSPQLIFKRNMMDALSSDFEKAANSKVIYDTEIKDVDNKISTLKNRVQPKSFIDIFVRAWEIVTRSSQERLQNDFNLHLSNEVICKAKEMFITYLSPYKYYCRNHNYSEADNLYGRQNNSYNTHYFDFGFRLITSQCSSNEATIRTAEFKDILLAIALEFLVIADLADKQSLDLTWIQFYRITCWFVPVNFYRYQNSRMLKTSYVNKNDIISFRKFIAKDIHNYEKPPMLRLRD